MEKDNADPAYSNMETELGTGNENSDDGEVVIRASNCQYYMYSVIFMPYIWHTTPFPCVMTRNERANGTVTYVMSVYA
jgi:formylmethanofuran dehydrogenase subunit D